LTDLDERLTLAFADLFAQNRSRFFGGEVSGGPGYYGVQVAAVAADASEVELVLTFRAGVRYCCFESACHFAYYDERRWRRLRECLDRHGLGHLPIPVIRTFRGVIEPGAVGQPGGIVGAPEACFVMEGSQYETGPWHPIIPSPAESGAAPERRARRLSQRCSSPRAGLVSLIGRPQESGCGMTEAEWLEATHPRAMLEAVANDVSPRRLRLLACGYCCLIWRKLSSHNRKLVEAAEAFADGRLGAEEWTAIQDDARAGVEDYGGSPGSQAAACAACDVSAVLGYWKTLAAWVWEVSWLVVAELTKWDGPSGTFPPPSEEFAVQATLARCVLGNPFRPVAFSLQWRTDDTVRLARHMDESRDFDAMPILADALEDAGCDSVDILDHCRGSGPHVRGCWVVDLVLGKE
jgi:hypothetical protein